eukprot:3018329-Pyramimonas_sp.AAC.1
MQQRGVRCDDANVASMELPAMLSGCHETQECTSDSFRSRGAGAATPSVGSLGNPFRCDTPFEDPFSSGSPGSHQMPNQRAIAKCLGTKGAFLFSFLAGIVAIPPLI